MIKDVDGGVLCVADFASGIGAAGLSIDVDDFPFLRLIAWQSCRPLLPRLSSAGRRLLCGSTKAGTSL